MATDTQSRSRGFTARFGPLLEYRLIVLALLFAWGFLDTLTTHAMITIGAYDSHPVVVWLVDAGLVEFWAFKLASAALLGVFLLGLEPYIEDPEHPYVTLALKAVLVLGVVAVVLLGPVTHAWVWAANGYPGVV